MDTSEGDDNYISDEDSDHEPWLAKEYWVINITFFFQYNIYLTQPF
jgi:hypothetical protein